VKKKMARKFPHEQGKSREKKTIFTKSKAIQFRSKNKASPKNQDSQPKRIPEL